MSFWVPKIESKQVFLAINPSPGGVKPYNTTPTAPRFVKPVVFSFLILFLFIRPQPSVPQLQAQPQYQQRPVPQTSDQVPLDSEDVHLSLFVDQIMVL